MQTRKGYSKGPNRELHKRTIGVATRVGIVQESALEGCIDPILSHLGVRSLRPQVERMPIWDRTSPLLTFPLLHALQHSLKGGAQPFVVGLWRDKHHKDH